MSAAAQRHEPMSAGIGARSSWYAVHTRSNFEKRVAAELLVKGVESYLPVVRERHQWKDRKKLIETPAFRGYVFVRCASLALEQLTILNTAGAVRILGHGGVPERIPDEEIDAIRVLVNSGMPLTNHAFLQEGNTVFVKSGPLKGVYGVLLTVKNTRRLVVSVSLLSQSVAAELDAADVEPINRIAGRTSGTE